jgi:hypothetical protein
MGCHSRCRDILGKTMDKKLSVEPMEAKKVLNLMAKTGHGSSEFLMLRMNIFSYSSNYLNAAMVASTSRVFIPAVRMVLVSINNTL